MTSHSSAKPGRFVPTLTEVVDVPSLPARPPDVPAPACVTVEAEALPDRAALEARVLSRVQMALDEHIRATVHHLLQEQQLWMVQTLRAELAPVLQALVADAVSLELDARKPSGS